MTYLDEWKRDMQLRRRGYKPGWSPQFARAQRELKMTPQEEYLYRHHLTNLSKGGVVHRNGSISTLLQGTYGDTAKFYNIPTVWNNQIVSDQQAWQLANKAGLQNFPSYPDERTAQSRYDAMHGYMDQDMRDWFNANTISQRPQSSDAGRLEGP